MIPVEILNILNAIPEVNGRVYPLQATSNTPKPYIIYKQVEILEGFSYEGEQRQDHTVIIKIYHSTFNDLTALRDPIFDALAQHADTNTQTVQVHSLTEDIDEETGLFFYEFICTFYGAKIQ